MKKIFSKISMVFNYLFFLSAVVAFPMGPNIYVVLIMISFIIAIILSIEALKKIEGFVKILSTSRKIIIPVIYAYWILLTTFFILNSSLKYYFLIIISTIIFSIFNKRLISSRLFLFLFWAFVGYLCFRIEFVTRYLYIILTILMVIFGTYKYSFISRLNTHIIILFFVSCLTIPISARLGIGIYKNEYKVIERQPGVRTIFGYGRNETIDGLVGRQIRFVSESCDGNLVYIGSLDYESGEKPFFVAIDRNNGEIQKSEHPVNSSYNVAIDCRNDLIYVANIYFNEILVFRQQDISRPIKRYPVKNDDIWFVFISPKRGLLYVGDGHHYLQVIDVNSSSEVFHLGFGGNDFRLLDNDRIAIRHQSYIYMLDLDETEMTYFMTKRIDVEQLKNILLPNKEVISPPRYERADSTIMSGFGRIGIIDINNLYMKGRIRLESGVRFYNYDERRNLLFVGGFLKGGLFIIDVDKMVVLKRLYMGRRIRWIDISRDGDRILLGSAAGAFEIDIESQIK